MSVFNKVLIALDVYHDFRDDPEHQPLEITKTMAMIGNRVDAQIYLVGCGFEEFLHDSYSNFGPDAVKQRKEFCAEMERRLEMFSNTLESKGFKVECRAHWTYPRYEQIVKEAQELDVDLIVQHVNMRQPHELHNLSHDSWQLVKTCNKPLLLIRDEAWPKEPVILAAVDPVHSHHKPLGLDYAILNAATETRKLIGGTINVVHAFSASALGFASPGSILEIHSKAMDELLTDYAIPSHAVHLRDERPVNAILQVQDALHANIVVLGALSRSRLSEAIIGNTADRLLNFVKSDLLIIKPS